MNKKVVITLSVLFALFIVLLGGGIYYASTLLRPEEIRRMAIEQLEEAFPKADVQLGDISVRLGLSTRLNLESLKIELNGDEVVPLLSVDDLTIRIPVWAIIRGRGTVEVSSNAPQIHYAEMDSTNNWFVALGEEGEDEASPSERRQEEPRSQSELSASTLAIPAFVLHSDLNIKIRDLKVSYKLEEMDGDLTISRFIVKNLNLLVPSAFEIDSRMRFGLEDDSEILFDTLVIGEFDLSKLISSELFTMRSVIKVNNLRTPYSSKTIPEIKLDLVNTIDKDGHLSAEIKGEIQSSRFETNISLAERGLAVDSYELSLSLDEIIKMTDLNLSDLNAGRTRIASKGSITLYEGEGIRPDVSFSLSPALTYSLNNAPIRVSSGGSLKGQRFQTDLDLEAFGGNITTKVSGTIDLNMEDFSVDKLPPMEIATHITNMRLERDYIQALLYSEREGTAAKTEETTSSPSAVASQEQVPLVLPRSVVNLSFNNLFIDGNDITGEGRIVIGTDSIVTEKLNFSYSQGRGELKHTTRIRDNMRLDNTFDFTMRGLDLSGIDAFLPPMLGGISGTFSGSFKGKANLISAEELNYDVDVDVTATDGEVKGLNFSEQVNALVESLPMLKDRLPQGRAYEVDENFESLIFKGKLTDRRYTFNTYEFKGIDNKVEIKGTGFLIPPPHTGRSELTLTVIDHSGKVSRVLEQHIGTNQVPIRLRGEGFNLMPDIEYTLGRVARSAVEGQIRQRLESSGAQEKVEERVEKEVDRLKDQGREQLNRLLRRR